jgi:hypothetical protein
MRVNAGDGMNYFHQDALIHLKKPCGKLWNYSTHINPNPNRNPYPRTNANPHFCK